MHSSSAHNSSGGGGGNHAGAAAATMIGVAPHNTPAAMMVVLLSALAVHVPSVLFATRVHRLRAISLLEKIVYYCMVQVAALVLLGALLPPQYASLEWTVCGYFVLYFCAHVDSTLRLLPNSTLSDTALHWAVLLSMAVLAPNIAARSIPEEQPSAFRNHAVACVLADAVQLLCARAV